MSQTQQFDGKSIEAALAAAAGTLGPNVQVAEARKVRKGGVLGFFAHERYEVEAFTTEPAPAPAPAPAAAPAASPPVAAPRTIEAAFDTLLAEVEAAEEVGIPPLKPEPSWVNSLSEFLSEEATAALPPLEGRHFAKPANPDIQHTAATTLISDGDEARIRRARVAGGEPEWSAEALFMLGVPKLICEHVEAANATTDLEWMNALEAAIEALTPPTARSTDLICSLGQGRVAAVAILRAAIAGIPPGILYIDGVEVVASPTELALAVRSCLPR